MRGCWACGPPGAASAWYGCPGLDDSEETLRYPRKLFEFACITVRVVQFLHTRAPIGRALTYQVLKSGISAGANYEEGDDGSSGRDAVAKMRISLRELKETRFRLRILRATGFLFKAQDPVIAECDELVRIVASIVRNKRSKATLSNFQLPVSQTPNWELGVGSWKLIKPAGQPEDRPATPGARAPSTRPRRP